MKRPVLLFIFYFFTLSSIYCQKSFFEKAQIIKSSGDTLNGFVERVSEVAISRKVVFKNKLEVNQKINLTADEILQLLFLKDSVYFDQIDYKYTDSIKNVEEKRLAKRMLAGSISLFKLQIPEDEYEVLSLPKENAKVYIIRKDNNDYILKQVDMSVDDVFGTSVLKRVVIVPRYKGVLLFLFADDNSIKTKIEKLRFDDESMRSVVKEYCEHMSPSEKPEEYSYKVSNLVWHGPELSYLHLEKTSNDIQGFDEIGYRGTGFKIGYVFSFIQPEISSKISTNIGIEYIRLKFVKEETSKYDFSVLNIPVLLGYNFTKTKVGPYLKGGISFVDFFTTKPILSIHLCPTLAAGFTILNKWNVAFIYQNGSFKIPSDRILFATIGYNFE